MKRKMLILLVSILMPAVCMVFFISCNCKSNNPPPPIEERLSLNKSSLEMIVGDKFLLEASYNELPDGKLTYAVDCKEETVNVITIKNDGTIIAENVGSATIIVGYGSKTATCEVTVTLDEEEVPTVAYEGIGGSEQITIKDTMNVAVKVSYNNKKFLPDTIFYTLTDETFGSIVNGVFIPAKIGTVKLNAVAKWQGVNMNLPEIIITIIATPPTIILNNGSSERYDLCTVAQYKGQNFTNEIDFVITVIQNNEDLSSSAQYDIISGEDVVSISGGKIKGLKKGEAQVEISCVGKDKETYTKIYTFNVSLPQIEVEEVLDFSIAEGAFSQSQLRVLFDNENPQIIDISCEDKNINANIDAGKVKISGDYDFNTPIKFTIEGQQNISVVRLKLYSDIIFSAEGLNALIRRENDKIDGKIVNNDGYYILGDNINLNYVDLAQDPTWNVETSGFTGILDGRGYTIDKYLVQKFGLFGYISRQAEIKNLALTNVKFGAKGSTGVLAKEISSTSKNDAPTISNVYIQVIDFNNLDEVATLAFKRTGTGGYEKIENCVFEAKNEGVKYAASVYTYDSSRLQTDNRWQVSNTYVISSIPVVTDKGFDAVNKNPTISAIAGFVRYDDYEEMQLTNANYSLFNTDCWDIVTYNLPVWKNLPSDLKTPTITLNDGIENISLYTTAGLENLPTSLYLTATANTFGKELPIEIFLENNDGVVSISDNVLSANKKGNATLVITVKGTIFKKEIPITVYWATEVKDITLDYSINDGFTSQQITSVFGSPVIITDVSCSDSGIIVGLNNNKLVLSGNLTYDTPISFNLYSDGQGYTVKLKLYTDIITTPDEVKDLIILNGGGTAGNFMNNNGYYILGNDINLNYQDFNQDPWSIRNASFTGTLDGRGHVINNYLVQKYGLFGYISDKAVIKNVAITNAKFGCSQGNPLGSGVLAFGIKSTSKATAPIISNVYVQVVNLNGQSGTVGIANERKGGYEKIENCIFEVLCTNTTDSSGSLFMYDSSRLSSAENCQVSNTYVISTLRVTSDTGFDASNKNPANIIAGFIRYDSYEEMSGVVSNDYSSFSTEYWNITEKGYPLWKGCLIFN